RAKEQTEMTMAFRTPTLENTCGPVALVTHTAAISSSSRSTLRLGPTKNSLIGTDRLERDDDSSTSAPHARSGGGQSPAGDAETRLPPLGPPVGIGGEPTVRAAAARPGRSSERSPMMS